MLNRWVEKTVSYTRFGNRVIDRVSTSYFRFVQPGMKKQ